MRCGVCGSFGRMCVCAKCLQFDLDLRHVKDGQVHQRMAELQQQIRQHTVTHTSAAAATGVAPTPPSSSTRRQQRWALKCKRAIVEGNEEPSH